MPASKAKIGFSIDSIVGGGDDVTKSSKDNRGDYKCGNEYQTEIARALRLSSDSVANDSHIKFRAEQNGNQKELRSLFDYSMKREASQSPAAQFSAAQTSLPSEEHVIRRSRSPSPHRTPIGVNNNSSSAPNNNNNSISGEAPGALPFLNGMPNGVPIRPMPIVPQNLAETKTVQPVLPPYFGIGAAAAAASAHANPHIIQAQIQMAAAMARQAEQFPPGAPFRHGPPPHMAMNPAAMGRESYPLYPWLLSRHGRLFPPGFPGSK